MRIGSAVVLTLLSGTLALSPAGGAGHDPGHRPDGGATASSPPGESGLVEVSIPDVALVNQDDKSIRFYSDLVKGRSVAIEFIYTTCTTICPLLGITFSQVQDLLGDRLGKEVALISISVDPVTDTPQRLKAWGAKFHAKPGWTFLTGKKSDIDKVLRALGAATGRKEDHPPTILMGNEAQGRWTRAYGLAPPGRIVAFLDGMPKGPGVPPARGEGRAK